MLGKRGISVVIFGIVFWFCAQHETQAQEVEQLGHTVLKISPVEFGHAEFKVGIEQFLGSRKSSISVIPSATLKESLREKKEGWQVIMQYRFYLSHINKVNRNTLFGFEEYAFYTGVFGLYQDYAEDYTRDYYNMVTDTYESGKFSKELTAQEGGLILGLQISITKRIIVDLNLGGSIRNNEITDDYIYDTDYNYDDYSFFEPEYKGVKPVLGFMLGIVL